MAKKYSPRYTYCLEETNKINVVIPYSKEQEFNQSLLGIGDFEGFPEQKDVIAAVFDLEGFTDFCACVDPQLYVPRFLKEFLDWLYESIREVFTKKTNKKEVILDAELPFFSKFLGDGVLFMWNIDSKKIYDVCNNKKEYDELMNKFLCNIIGSLDLIQWFYGDFYESNGKKYRNAPSRLRCGIARGQVCSVGGGADYVGPCINIASRLQKFHGLGFACYSQGIDIKKGGYERDYILKKVNIRGIGEEELVYVERSDYEKLSPEEKIHFVDP